MKGTDPEGLHVELRAGVSLALCRGEKTAARKAMEAAAKTKAAPVRKKSAGKRPSAPKGAR